jgi:hypothetical protein
MKCIADKMDRQTYRVSNAEADRRIASGRYERTSKRNWKLQGRCR